MRRGQTEKPKNPKKKTKFLWVATLKCVPRQAPDFVIKIARSMMQTPNIERTPLTVKLTNS